MTEINPNPNYDAILLVSFGGPEAPEEVMPFLENVLRGKNVPRERMLAVSEHYQHFGGRSPINQQNRQLIAALEAELAQHGPHLPIYWGNRNWHPMLADTLRQMKADGIQRALGFFTSAYSSYSGCRQYRENIAAAQAEGGEGAPQVEKLRVFFNHPGFVLPMAERVRTAIAQLPEPLRDQAHIIFTAHSIPLSMAQGCNYVKQLEESCRLVFAEVGSAPKVSAEAGAQEVSAQVVSTEVSAAVTRSGLPSHELARPAHRLVFQSRSGPATQPWLEPDILDTLRQLKQEQAAAVVIAPIGFISDHMEVLYDLDTEARDLCRQLDLPMARAGTVGAHPAFISMIRELIVERMSADPLRLALGTFGPSHDVCPLDCCLMPRRPS